MSELKVFLGDFLVGQIHLLPSNQMIFTFDSSYLQNPNRPILSQSFVRSDGQLIQESKMTRNQLPAFFSNLLPEGTMRQYLAKQNNINPDHEFQLIKILGRDLPGAVVITSQSEPWPLVERPKAMRPKDRTLHFSLAGIQLKFSATRLKSGRLTIPATGAGGNWIVKLPAQNYPHVPENEFAIMHLAGSIGIPVPEIKLVLLDQIGDLPDMGLLNGNQALAVKRFDRAKKRIHMEDFAQIYGVYPHHKYTKASYANLASMIWILTGETGLKDFIRRLTFVVLTGNGDMHLKNWSFLYADGKTPTLSPAYDLLSTIPYLPQDGLALNLGENKIMSSINLDHFKKLAQKARIPEFIVLQTVRETTDATLTLWDRQKKDYNLPQAILERINLHMTNTALATGK